MKKKLIVFDLDGVLIDSKSNMNAAWIAVMEKHNIQVTFEEYFQLIGRPFVDILSSLGIDGDHLKIADTYSQYSLENSSLIELFPGVQTTLHWIANAGLKTAVVTSKDKERTKTFLKMMDHQFDLVSTPNEKLPGKPAPDHLLHVMAALHCDPTETIYVGDMIVDKLAAQSASVDYLHASWGYGVAVKDVNCLQNIEALTELISCLD